ncbi:unnamed protein product [Clonostachys rhizophaga]|uniref:Uncharacterized protein n=1 Tax=Clonostachys rhizophaga TaxID=160324 RepID=A0A9N9YYG0_9HYPO|nr:unnamed protein product [Clonostachys rhizophaga]
MKFPVSGPQGHGYPSTQPRRAKRRFVTSSRELLSEARNTFPDRIFRIMTDLGEVMLLPHQFAEEIKNDHRFSFTTAFEKDFHAGIPGFETAELGGLENGLLQLIARKQLTRNLGKSHTVPSAMGELSTALSDETANALAINFESSGMWTEVVAKDRVLDIVARVSSRIYLGDEVCRNARWLAITKLYTTHFFTAATKLRMYPRIVRHLVHWFIPECKLLRSQFNDAQKILQPIVDRRKDLRRAAVATCELVPEFDDALGWVEREAAAKSVDCNPSIFQLLLSTVSINTTTDLLEQCMLYLAQDPGIISSLREEIHDVLRHHGWSKSSLSNMKLLDSVIKESQRLKPTSIAAMRRLVEEDVTLSNGVTLKRGMRVYVDASRMWDPNLYHHPEQWDGYRFLKLRSIPGRERMAQLASTSPDHLAFGHGEHACPGRFLAISVIKIVLCHLLLKYDWMLSPGTDVKPVTNGILAVSSPTARLLIRRRRGAAAAPGVIE